MGYNRVTCNLKKIISQVTRFELNVTFVTARNLGKVTTLHVQNKEFRYEKMHRNFCNLTL